MMSVWAFRCRLDFIRGKLKPSFDWLLVIESTNLNAFFIFLKCALILLETAIKESQWHHVRDLMRFLKATSESAIVDEFRE